MCKLLFLLFYFYCCSFKKILGSLKYTGCYGLNVCVLSKFTCCYLNAQLLSTIIIIVGGGSLGGDEVMRTDLQWMRLMLFFKKSPEWAPLPLSPCEDSKKSWQSATWKGAFTTHTICRCPDLELPRLQNCGQYISVLNKVLSSWYFCESSLNRLRHWVFIKKFE